jgi:hypothetical protein
VILWQTPKDADPLIDALPQGTRKVWDEAAEDHWRAELRRIEEIEVRRILAFRDFVDKAEEVVGEPPPPDAARALLHKKLVKVFPLFRPPAGNAGE